MNHQIAKALSPGEEVELSQEFIVLAIPDDTVELTITAKIYMDHELREVQSRMDFPDVRAAIREAQDGYIPSDALFTLMPTKKERLKELLDRYTQEDEE